MIAGFLKHTEAETSFRSPPERIVGGGEIHRGIPLARGFTSLALGDDYGIMDRSFRFRPEEKGAALVIALLTILLMFSLTIPFLSKLTARYQTTERSYKTLAAMSLAEAGVERAIWELNYGNISSWSGTILSRTLALTGVQAAGGQTVGDILIEVANPQSDDPVVTSTGKVPWVGDEDLQKTVRVALRRGFKSYFDFGVFGDEGFEMHGNAYTDSYDPEEGPYDPKSPGTFGDVGTNATHQWDVVLLNNVVVHGDAITGYGSNPELVIELQNRARIDGVEGSLDAPKLLPDPEPPFLTSRGAFTASGTQTVISQSGTYTSFTLPTNTKVTISGNVQLYINGNFTMNSNSILDIAEGSQVEITLGNGTFTQESNTQVNNLTHDPKKLAILGTADFHNMVWRSNTQFWGVMYLPEAYVDYSANVDFFGSIICNYLYLSSNAGIHYDEALGTWDKYGTYSGDLVVKTWQEIY
jgi:Tfp pilus assembly protein PilX